MSKPHTGPAQPADRLHLLPRHREMLLALLREHLPGIEVWAYGSRVNGQSHDGSDLDLVLRSPDLQKIPIGQVADLREALRESNIPFLVEARDWARLPKGFHPEIEREYVVLVEPPERPDRNRWLETTLGKVVTLKRGYDLPQRERGHGSVPVVSSSGITDYHSESKVSGPGVVTGRYGTLGQVFFIPGDFWPHNTALYVQDFKGNDPRFINYLLQSLDFSAYSDKTAVPGLNRNHLHEGLVRIPASIDEQRAIAHILGTLDDKIELNRRMNETLESMARALFKSWFVDFDPVHAKATLKRHAANQTPRRGNSTRATKAAPSDHSPLRGESERQGRQPEGEPVGGNRTPLPLPKGSDWTVERARAYLDRMEPEIAALFPDSFAASELGAIPAGWEVKPLGSLIELAYGKALKADQRQAGSVPVYGSNGRVGWHDRPFIQGPSIIVGRKGNPGTVTWAAGPCFPIDTTFHVVPKDTPQSLPFLFYALKGQGLASVAADSAVPGLNRNLAYHNKQVTPPPPVVARFGEQVQSLFARRHSLEEEIRTLASLRDTLLPKLVSGEIRIPDAMLRRGRGDSRR